MQECIRASAKLFSVMFDVKIYFSRSIWLPESLDSCIGVTNSGKHAPFSVRIYISTPWTSHDHQPFFSGDAIIPFQLNPFSWSKACWQYFPRAPLELAAFFHMPGQRLGNVDKLRTDDRVCKPRQLLMPVLGFVILSLPGSFQVFPLEKPHRLNISLLSRTVEIS